MFGSVSLWLFFRRFLFSILCSRIWADSFCFDYLLSLAFSFSLSLSFGFTDLISAFIVSYQINRGEPTDIAQLELSAIWAGVAIGRIIFSGIIFSKLVKSIPEKIFSILLLGCTAGFLGLLIAVHHAAVNGIALLLIGVFIGPVTPRALSMLGARVPNSIRGSTISMAVSSGLVGAGILPYAFGFAIDKNMNILNSLPAVLVSFFHTEEKGTTQTLTSNIFFPSLTLIDFLFYYHDLYLDVCYPNTISIICKISCKSWRFGICRTSRTCRLKVKVICMEICLNLFCWIACFLFLQYYFVCIELLTRIESGSKSLNWNWRVKELQQIVCIRNL